CFSAGEAITHRVAIGHVIVDEKPTVARPWAFPRATTPVGGIVSTANDLMRYARFHLGDGRAPDGARLLRRESLDLIRTPLSDAELELSDTGLVYRTFSHNKLNVQPKPPDPPPSRVAFTSDARFTLLDGPLKDTRGEFLRGPDGLVRYLRVGGRVYRRTRS